MPATNVNYPWPVYRDKWVRLIGIPVITGFGYYLTYDDIQFGGWLIYEVLSDAVKIFMVWYTSKSLCW